MWQPVTNRRGKRRTEGNRRPQRADTWCLPIYSLAEASRGTRPPNTAAAHTASNTGAHPPGLSRKAASAPASTSQRPTMAAPRLVAWNAMRRTPFPTTKPLKSSKGPAGAAHVQHAKGPGPANTCPRTAGKECRKVYFSCKIYTQENISLPRARLFTVCPHHAGRIPSARRPRSFRLRFLLKAPCCARPSEAA